MSDNATAEIMMWSIGRVLKGLGVLALILGVLMYIASWLFGMGVGMWLSRML